MGEPMTNVTPIRPTMVLTCACGAPGEMQPDDLVRCAACYAKAYPSEKPSRWVPVAETAKTIRAALKAKFPGVKFSVRSQSYSMGSSVHVRWSDGPTEKQVEKIACAHEKIDRDGYGEILSGGNRFVQCNREIGERIQKYGNARAEEISGWTGQWEKERHANNVMRSTEMRPDGQLLEWGNR
jgi:hypothetical protein